MNSSPGAERSATAFQLAARLERYEAGLEALIQAGFDADRCRLLVHELREIGASAMSLPQLAADLMDIEIQHARLVRVLCQRAVAGEGARGEAQRALLQQQREAVQGVRAKCMQMIPGFKCNRRAAVRRRSRGGVS